MTFLPLPATKERRCMRMSKHLEIHLLREFVVLPGPIMVHSTAEELTQLKGILKRIMNRYENNECPPLDSEKRKR